MPSFCGTKKSPPTLIPLLTTLRMREPQRKKISRKIPRLLAPRPDVFFSRLDLQLNLSPEREQKLFCGAYLLLKGFVMPALKL